MRAVSRHFFPLAGSFLFLVAPLSAQEAPAGAPVAGVPVAGAPATADATTTWTTFKGDPQRSGGSKANVRLPLSLQWRYSSDAPSREFSTSPLVIGAQGRQLVVFGAGTNVYALDPQTGAQVWRSPNFTSEIVTPITLMSGETGDLILVAQQSGRVAAIRTSDGGRAWETDALSSIVAAGPVVVETAKGRRIILAVSAGRLIALNVDGSIDSDWQVPLGRYGISPSSPMAVSSDGGIIFICGSDAKMYAIDARQGAMAYSIQLAANSSVSPVVAGDQVITSNVRRVSSFKALGGSSVWNFDPRGEIIGSPSVGTDIAGNRVVYFGTRNGLFYAVDATGAQVWKADVGAGITGSPLVLPSMVVVGTSNGLLMGFDPANGALVWEYRLKTDRAVQRPTNQGRGGRGGFGGFGGGGATPFNPNQLRIWGVSSAPTAVNNQLYVLGDNAALYSFSMSSFDASPPRVIEPSLAVPNDQDKIAALLLRADPPQVVPGRGPIYFAAQLDDTGSGVNAKSLKVSLDGIALPADAVDYQAATGILTVTLLDPQKGGTAFPDGLKNLSLTVLDYAGNQLQYNIAFLIDNTAPAPSSQPQRGRFGGFGGGFFGGGGGQFGGGGPFGGGGGGPFGGGPNDPNNGGQDGGLGLPGGDAGGLGGTPGDDDNNDGPGGPGGGGPFGGGGLDGGR